MATIEDLDRRVTALEKKVEHEESIERVVAEIVSESEQRLQREMQRLHVEMSTLRTELRLEMKLGEHRIIEAVNDIVDKLFTRLDRPKDA